MQKILLIIILLQCKLLVSQTHITVVNAVTNIAIEGVEVLDNDTLLGLTDSSGSFIVTKKGEDLILRKKKYFDKKINLQNTQLPIKLEPIVGTLLDEVVITSVKNFTLYDKIYNNFLSRKTYHLNYHFKNLYIDFYTKNCDFIKINEYSHKGMLDKSNSRTLNLSIVTYNDDFYKNQPIKSSGSAHVVFCESKSFILPTPLSSAIYKNSFFYFNEIHHFFKNYKKVKHKFIQDSKNYLISYTYKSEINKFMYNISLVIDKDTNTIINFTKELIKNKKNIINLHQPNTNYSYNYFIKNHKETVYFKLNDNGLFDLISEDIIVEYDVIESKKSSTTFYYNYTLEPTVERDINLNNFVDISKILENNNF